MTDGQPDDVPMEDRHPMTGNRMSSDEDTGRGVEKHEYDVVVIGAGGSGLRAAIAAHEAGAKAAIVCKSLLGKAHTVMAEGGIAAAHGQPAGPRTTGRCTSATPCAAGRCSTTGGWPSCTPRRRPSGSWSSRTGARCSTAPRTA